MKRSVGVDIGATAVRIVEVAGLDSSSIAQVTRVQIAPMPPGAVVGGRVRDAAAVGFVLSQAFKASRISPYGAILGVASPDAAVAPVVMPAALKPAEWVKTLRLQQRAISPKVAIHDSAISLDRIRADDGDNGGRTMLLAAATLHSEVAALLAACRAAKVTPAAIDLAGAATMRCLARAVPGVDDVLTFVDIGASKVTVTTRQGLYLRSVRTFEGGGDKITRAIMGATGGSYEDAEARKHAMRAGQASGPAAATTLRKGGGYGAAQETGVNDTGVVDPAAEALNGSTEALIEEIATAVEQDHDSHRNAPPTQGIVLCGGGALLQGLRDMVSHRVGVPTIVGRPWATLVASRKTADLLVDGHEDPEDLMLSIATAVGLAMWKGNA